MSDSARTLFMSIGMARIAKLIPTIPDAMPSPVKGALLSRMIPPLYYLMIVAAFDDALVEYLEIKEIPWPKKMKPDLYNRINVVSEFAPNLSTDMLHKIRERRNLIGHRPDSVISDPVTWDELDEAIDCICSSIKEMGIIRSIPLITAGFIREKAEILGDELGPNGVSLRVQHKVWAQLDDKKLISFEFEIPYG